MSAGSEAVLYDIYGDPMAVEVDTAIPAGTATLIGGGSDGTNARFIRVNSDGYQIIIGSGIAGVPSSGVVTIQGSVGGTDVPISGTVTANAGSGNFAVVQATASNLLASVGGLGAAGASSVGNPVLIAGSDGSVTRTIRTASDGTVRIDPTGTTIQPISGTVTANIGTTGGLALDTTLAKLTIAPGTAIGSNTLAMVGGHVTTVSPTYTNGNINTLSLTTAGALRTDSSGVTQPVSGTVTSNQGTSPWVTNVSQFGGNNVVTGTGASGTGIPRVTVSNDSNILATQSGTWTVQQGTPPWSVAGTAADGAAVSGNPVRIGGSDGTNTQDILTDTSGRQQIVGASADGATVAGNPVLMGGQDGTNAQSILTDTTGRQVMVGAAADGTAVTGNPVLMAGQDGTNAQSISTDTTGRLSIVGAAADGAAVTGNPVLVGGTDGTNAQTVELRNTHPVGDVQGVIVRNIETSFPTFHAVFDRISPAANKYMATLWNGASGRKVVVQRIWRFNWQVATVTGTTLDQELRRITARTAGTSVTPIALDSNDTLTSGITADHNSSSVTDSSLLQRVMAVSEERDGLDTRVVDWLALYPFALVYDRKDGTRGIVLRENQGLTIKNITSSTVGTVSYIIEFTDEVA